MSTQNTCTCLMSCNIGVNIYLKCKLLERQPFCSTWTRSCTHEPKVYEITTREPFFRTERQMTSQNVWAIKVMSSDTSQLHSYRVQINCDRDRCVVLHSSNISQECSINCAWTSILGIFSLRFSLTWSWVVTQVQVDASCVHVVRRFYDIVLGEQLGHLDLTTRHFLLGRPLGLSSSTGCNVTLFLWTKDHFDEQIWIPLVSCAVKSNPTHYCFQHHWNVTEVLFVQLVQRMVGN